MNLRSEEKSWALWCHLASLAALLGIPFGNLVGPLIVWQMKKSESQFVDEHGKESLNFQLSFTLYIVAAVIALILFVIIMIGFGANRTKSGGPPGALMPLLFGGGLLGPFIALMLFPLVSTIFAIVAGVKASNGEMYRYPFTIRFLR